MCYVAAMHAFPHMRRVLELSTDDKNSIDCIMLRIIIIMLRTV